VSCISSLVPTCANKEWSNHWHDLVTKAIHSVIDPGRVTWSRGESQLPNIWLEEFWKRREKGGAGWKKIEIVGPILLKELLQYKMSRDVPVCLLKMRSLPRWGQLSVGFECLSVWVVRFWNEQKGDGVSIPAQGNRCSRWQMSKGTGSTFNIHRFAPAWDTCLLNAKISIFRDVLR